MVSQFSPCGCLTVHGCPMYWANVCLLPPLAGVPLSWGSFRKWGISMVLFLGVCALDWSNQGVFLEWGWGLTFGALQLFVWCVLEVDHELSYVEPSLARVVLWWLRACGLSGAVDHLFSWHAEYCKILSALV